MSDAGATNFAQPVDGPLGGLPDDIRCLMTNVVVTVEDEPPPGQNLLGLYEGVPWGRRGPYYSGALPDKITIYRPPPPGAARRRSRAAAGRGAARRLPRDRPPLRHQRPTARRHRPLLS